eukprot:COSAG03_NODE_16980_length_387_cov_0.711806_1_plen_46_part_10
MRADMLPALSLKDGWATVEIGGNVTLDERPPNHPLQVASLSLSLVT